MINCEAISRRILIKFFPQYFELETEGDRNAFRYNIISQQVDKIQTEITNLILSYRENDIKSSIDLEYYCSWVLQYLIGVGHNYLTLTDATTCDKPLINYNTIYDFNNDDYNFITDNDDSFLSLDIVDMWGRAIIQNKLFYISIQSASRTIMSEIERVATEAVDKIHNLEQYLDLSSKIDITNSLTNSTYFDDLDLAGGYVLDRLKIINEKFQNLPPFTVLHERDIIHPEILFIFSNNKALKKITINNMWNDANNLVDYSQSSILDWNTIYEKQKLDMWILKNFGV